MFSEYDIIVVGAGHAGCEAAVAASKLGSNVLLITMSLQSIAQMSCNPAMGGIAKGQIVREIDAMGGYSGVITDKCSIQFRMLNRSKGAAMWSPRAQVDRHQFHLEWRSALEQIENIDFWQDVVSNLLINKQQQVYGVETSLGVKIKSKSVILTTGTFLNGKIHIGEKFFKGGRIGEKESFGLTEQLVSLGMEAGRMKTGTPPRLDGRSLNYNLMEQQNGDEEIGRFSFENIPLPKKQRSCYITYTNEDVHSILKRGFEQSPMFTGRIKGLGPRYCPSIEDKINRFSDRTRHQLFVEPEGWNTCEIYLNGFSTSLPEQIQFEALRKIPGLEQVKMLRPGYAIEYDFFFPTQLKLTLETKIIENLFFAGQINGTTGYEEAACQGLMAGVNAHRKIKKENGLILKRSEAYIGVLIDDLVTKGTNEPYRMFTSRAEHRLLLRQDNADERLSPIAHQLGLINDARLKKVQDKLNHTQKIIHFLKNTSISPKEINATLKDKGTSEISQSVKLIHILTRPQISIKDLQTDSEHLHQLLIHYDKESIEQAEIKIKYDAYFTKESEWISKMEKMEHRKIPSNFNYDNLISLSKESIEKLKKIQPETLGQANRIIGVSPADIAILMIYLNK